MVPFCIQSGHVGTMAIPAEPWRLVGSHCFWKAVVKSALTVSQPPSTYMVYAVGGGWDNTISVGVMEVGMAGHPLLVGRGSVLMMERTRRRSRPDWSG